jgi:hypothetical protein
MDYVGVLTVQVEPMIKLFVMYCRRLGNGFCSHRFWFCQRCINDHRRLYLPVLFLFDWSSELSYVGVGALVVQAVGVGDLGFGNWTMFAVAVSVIEAVCGLFMLALDP